MENYQNPVEQENELNLGDLIILVAKNWYWYVLSVVICTGLAFLYLQWAPKVYTRSASVLIKDDKNGGGSLTESGAFDDLGISVGSRNVDNEVLVFKANRLMEQVVRRLHLDINYSVQQGLRTVDLYTQSPVTLRFPEAEDSQAFGLTVTPVSEKEVTLSDFTMKDEAGEMSDVPGNFKVALGDSVQTPAGWVKVEANLDYTDRYFGKEIRVTKSPVEQVTNAYETALSATLASKTATIINLSLQDRSIPRADDVLNTLIAVYKEDVINDKNQVAVNTSNFIADRLVIIEQELGSVDANIESFKRENQLTDISSETGMYLQNTSQYRQEALSLQSQLQLAKYIKEYLVDPSKNSDLIPANTGVDANIESEISEYNTLLLKRDKLISNSSNKNPVVQDLNNSLNAMRQTIVRSVDNLIVSLNVKIRNVKAQEEQTSRRISAVPTQQKYVLSVERQQKIKEELYLYLLNKREETDFIRQSFHELRPGRIGNRINRGIPEAFKTLPDHRIKIKSLQHQNGQQHRNPPPGRRFAQDDPDCEEHERVHRHPHESPRRAENVAEMDDEFRHRKRKEHYVVPGDFDRERVEKKYRANRQKRREESPGRKSPESGMSPGDPQKQRKQNRHKHPRPEKRLPLVLPKIHSTPSPQPSSGASSVKRPSLLPR